MVGTVLVLRRTIVPWAHVDVYVGDARQAAEPVFSVADPVLFQDFGSVFRTDLDDPALRNAVLLTFALAVTGGNMDNECVGYQNRALAVVRERMSSPETAASLPTLGAILLLAGVEVRAWRRPEGFHPSPG
jgi:hypothetical protein